ncbi:ECF transporter S component [Eubacterium sp.]|uniref:ECF transporter S component n=1 Tax=Eubacterium sp. TaxID=142586 RepID=UPI0025DDA51E|nr:ECF transporter S component [Eubacterium sp.]MCR5629541.1 ATP-binding cassette domain-containing protein [Eubacterium sp.]
MLRFENFGFKYENSENSIFSNVNFEVNEGEVTLLIGKSGCGKSTLIRSIKPYMARKGITTGHIYYKDKDVNLLSDEELSHIGYVSQDIENQIVTDKVWHELAFGLENLGMPQKEMRLRCGEMAAYFGIEDWYNRDTDSLSIGQKQLLNLASVMVMKPDLLILDEPASTLDPVAESELLERVFRLNRDFGTTILIVMHELEEVFNRSDKIVFMDKESDLPLVVKDKKDMARYLIENNNNQIFGLPSASRICFELYKREDINFGDVPISISDGKRFLNENFDKINPYYKRNVVNIKSKEDSKNDNAENAIELKHVYYKYNKDSDFVLEDFALTVKEGEVYTIMGGNGCGKSTTLSIISKLINPNDGKVILFGKDIKKIKDEDIYGKLIGFIPQEPRNLFSKDTVLEELLGKVKGFSYDDLKVDDGLLKKIEDENKDLYDYITFFEIENVLSLNPFDISGGEMQKVAMIKVLLLNSKIIIMDEPTKGLDAFAKSKMASYIKKLKGMGKTVLLVSHDIEFSATVSDRLGFLFNRRIISDAIPTLFFTDNHFYTTVTRRITREYFKNVILIKDIFGEDDNDNNLSICKKKKSQDKNIDKTVENAKHKNTNKIDSNRIVNSENEKLDSHLVFRKLRNYIIVAALVYGIMLGISKTYADQRYFLMSVIVLLVSMIGLAVFFEKKKISGKRLVLIAALTALGVVGRVLFYMIPAFKPVGAISIIAGVALDPFSGFLCGSLMAFLSNAFFGQGSWTAFQMFSFGMVGFLAGIIGSLLRRSLNKGKSVSRKYIVAIAVYGFISIFLIYGFIMNFFTSLTAGKAIKETLLINIISGIPLDIIHGVSTAMFILILGRPLIRRIYRIKYKYEI